MSDCGVVFMTAASRQEAEKIANSLVEKRLAACVQILSDIQSIYWWEGKIRNDKEVFFMAKTTGQLFPALSDEVKKLHSYKVPEIIFVSIQDGSPEYMGWICEVTGKRTAP